jgi:hypothetical protein
MLLSLSCFPYSLGLIASVPRSLKFTSGSATTPSTGIHPSREAGDETSLDRFVRTSDVIKTLSRSEQRKKEGGLRGIEASRDERVREESECVDLEPVPTDEPTHPEH